MMSRLPDADPTRQTAPLQWQPNATMTDHAPDPTELEDQAIELLVHLHSGRATAEDHLAYRTWGARSAAHREAARQAEALWGALPQTQTAQNFHVQAQPAKRSRRRWLAPALAASVAALVLGIGFADRVSVLGADYRTAVGERREVQLADGSHLWLNSDTALSVDFSAERRDLRLLRGEADFAVAKDAARPFVVHAADGEVRAVGTRFDVNRRGERVAVTVSEGIVEVRSGGASARLTAGQGLAYSAAQAPGTVSAIAPGSANAWTRGKLIFNGQPLGQVLDELGRYLPGTLYLTDRKLGEQRISGVFELDDPEAALRILEQTQPLRVTRLPLLTVVRPRE